MQLSRRQQLIEQIAAAPGPTIAAKLCSVGETLGMDGTAIVLAPDERPTGVAATTGEFGDGLAQLELTLGEGPGHEAISNRAFVLADQLFTGPSERWPVFASQARERGIGAAFAFPLFLGSICVGVFEVCRTSLGKLPAQELIDFSHLASLATTALLLMQSGLGEGDLFDLLEAGDPTQLRIHQATGMAAQQASVSLVDALALIRGYALTQGLSLAEVAEQLVTRKIRMDTP